MTRIANSWKQHGLRTAILALTPVLIVGGYLWWTGEIAIDLGATTPEPLVHAAPPPVPALPERIGLNLDEQLVLVRRDVERLRAQEDLATAAATLGGALLRLGELERAVGNAEAGMTAFREVVGLHVDWQVRQAASRLEDLRILAERPAAAQEQWREAFKQHRQAEALHAKGQFREGVEVAERELKLRRELWDKGRGGQVGNNTIERQVGNLPHEQRRLETYPTSAEIGESLLRLAWLCSEHADFYLRAEDLARQALDNLKNAWGDSHPAYADGLFVLATLADDRGDFDEANRLYENARATYRNSVGEFSRQYARALSRQGRMHDTWWKDYAGAKLARAQYIRQQVLDPQDPDCAESLEFLGQSLYAVREFSRAERLLNQALALRIASQGEAHPDLARSMSLLGVCLVMRGDSSQAMLFAYDALAITEKARGANHPLASEQRLLLGLVKHWGTADYFGQIHLMQKARAALHDLKLERHPNYCQAIYGEAMALKSEHDRIRDTDAQAGETSVRLLAAALQRMQEAVNAYRALPHGTQIGESVTATFDLAHLHCLTEYAEADKEDVRRMLAEVERIVKKNGDTAHPAYPLLPEPHEKLARSEDHDRAIVLAKEHLQRVRDRWGTYNPWLQISARLGVHGAYVNEGKHPAIARPFSEEAFGIVFRIFQQDGPGQSAAARLSTLGDCLIIFSNLLSDASILHDLAAVYDQVLALKGSASSFQIAGRLAYDHSELTGRLNQVRLARQALKEAAFTGNASDPGWTERLLKASDEREIAESRLALETRTIVSPESATAEAAVTWAQLQPALPPKTAFIDFLQYTRHDKPPARRSALVREPSFLAYILTNSGPPVCVELGRSRPIRAAVTRWRRSIRSFQLRNSDSIDEATDELAKLIWAPLQEHLGEVDSLVIAPDGPLCFVSFAALPGRKSGTYALEDYSIQYTNSGRSLFQQLMSRKKAARGGLLACGDIQYQNGTRTHPKPSQDLLPDNQTVANLIASGPEIEAVKKLFTARFGADQEECVTLSRTNATAAAFAAALERSWRCVHFAGHGLFIPPFQAAALAGSIQYLAVPDASARNAVVRDDSGQGNHFVLRNQLLLSGLVLAADSPGDRKPGFLTAEDLGSIDLRGTDLVVLSACETGLGCTAGGDGVLGLTRAFLTAGASSVVSSLWKVDDAATSLLMQEFYRNLWERGLSKSEALRQTQLALLRNPSRLQGQQENLFAQLKRSLPDLTDDELRDELARSRRGIQAGATEDIDETEGAGEANSEAYTGLRMHPALWAAFILNGDGR